MGITWNLLPLQFYDDSNGVIACFLTSHLVRSTSGVRGVGAHQCLADPTTSQAMRGHVVMFMESLKTKLCQQIEQKLAYLNHTPHKLLGCLAHVYAGHGIEVSRRHCAEALAERDAMLAKGDGHKFHRVAAWLSVGHKTLGEVAYGRDRCRGGRCR